MMMVIDMMVNFIFVIVKLKLIPKDKAKESVRTQTEIVCSPSFKESQKTFSLTDFYSTVEQILVENSFPVGINALVIESCGHQIKRSHEEGHEETSNHTGTEGIEERAFFEPFLAFYEFYKMFEIYMKLDE